MTRPDTGNGVFIANKWSCMSWLYDVLNDASKFLYIKFVTINQIPHYLGKTSRIVTYFEK